jgi:hypothetical protein
MPKYCKWPWQKKLHDKSWRHMKLFKEEHKLLTLFRTCTRQFRIKSDQKSFHFMKLIDMLNFKNSIWRLIRTRSLNYDMLYFYIDKILNLFSYICLNLMFVCKRLWKNLLNLNIYLIRKKIASFAKCLAKVMLKIALDLFYISLNFNFTFNTFKIWSKSGTLTAMSANIL